MISFDRQTLRVLRFIRRHKGGVLFEEVERQYGMQDSVIPLLRMMAEEGYIVIFNREGSVHTPVFDVSNTRGTCQAEITPKGNELVERRSFDFWKFAIPLLISFVSLVISFIAVCR